MLNTEKWIISKKGNLLLKLMFINSIKFGRTLIQCKHILVEEKCTLDNEKFVNKDLLRISFRKSIFYENTFL